LQLNYLLLVFLPSLSISEIFYPFSSGVNFPPSSNLIKIHGKFLVLTEKIKSKFAGRLQKKVELEKIWKFQKIN